MMLNDNSSTAAETASPTQTAPPTAIPQAVVVPLTCDTIFLVATVNEGAESLNAVRSLCGDLPKLLRAVG